MMIELGQGFEIDGRKYNVADLFDDPKTGIAMVELDDIVTKVRFVLPEAFVSSALFLHTPAIDALSKRNAKLQEQLAAVTESRNGSIRSIEEKREEIYFWVDAAERVLAMFPTKTKVDITPTSLIAFMVGIKQRLEKAEINREALDLRSEIVSFEGEDYVPLHEYERLLGQLPESMQRCTIRFVECEKGHGRLTADNWVDNGCPKCKLDEARGKLRVGDVFETIDPSHWGDIVGTAFVSRIDGEVHRTIHVRALRKDDPEASDGCSMREEDFWMRFRRVHVTHDPKSKVPLPLHVSDVITVRQLKEFLARVPDTNLMEDDAEVWLGTGDGHSSPCRKLSPLNKRVDGDNESCDVILDIYREEN